MSLGRDTVAGHQVTRQISARQAMAGRRSTPPSHLVQPVCSHSSLMTTSIKDVSPKAVLAGAVTDIVATNVAMIPVAIFAFAQVRIPRASSAQQTAAFAATLSDNAWLYLAAMVLGCAASVLGGSVAARIARRAPLLNGMLSSVACVGFGIYGAIRHPGSAPAWQHAAFFILSPCLGALGGAIWRRRAERVEVSGVIAIEVDGAEARAELRRAQRVIHVVNRVLMVVAGAVLLSFGLIGLYGYSQHQVPVIIGAAFFCVLGLVAGGLLFVAGRRLRAGRTSHWVFHGGALAVASFPVVFVILALAARHRAG